MSKEVDMSQKLSSISRLNYLRDLNTCVKFYRDHPVPIGGDGRVVESDKKLFLLQAEVPPGLTVGQRVLCVWIS